MYPAIPPAGMRALGFFDGESRTGLAPPPVIRADAINPLTQDFASLTEDLDPIDAQVIDALWRVRQSGAAVENVGARFLDISKITDQAPFQYETEARRALAGLVGRGDILIKTIVVATGVADPEVGVVSDWAELKVDFVNLRAASKRDRSKSVRLPETVGR